MKDYTRAVHKVISIYGANPPVLVSALNTLVNTAVEDRQRLDVEEIGKLAKHLLDDAGKPLCKGTSSGVACVTCYEIEMARIAGAAEAGIGPAAPADPDVERTVREAMGLEESA